MPSYPDEVLADAPILYWRLGDASGSANAADSSGNGWTGAGVFNPSFGQAGALVGEADTAAHFAGNGPHIQSDTALTDFTAGGAWSVEFWIKTIATSGTVAMRSGLNPGYWLLTLNTGRLRLFHGYGNGQHDTYVADDAWHHVVVVGSGTGFTIYVDGVAGGFSNHAGWGAAGNGHPFRIGAQADGAASYAGLLDEVSVYGTALSAEQVGAHRDAGLGLAAPPMVAGAAALIGSSQATAVARVGHRSSAALVGGSTVAAFAGFVGTYVDAVLEDAPLLWWRMGDPVGSTTAADSSGNGWTGGVLFPGNAQWGQSGAIEGDADTAVKPSGAYIESAASLPQFTADGTWSLEVWLRRDLATSSGWGYILQRRFGAGGFRLEVPTAGANYGKLQWHVGGKVLASPGVVDDGGWHHVVGVVDGADARLYLDGGLVSSDTITPTGETGAGEPLRAAADESGFSAYVGFLDEIAVYEQALSAARVAAHWQAGRGAATEVDGAASIQGRGRLRAGAVRDPRAALARVLHQRVGFEATT